MPANTIISGPHAAVLAPRDSAGAFDERAFRAIVEFLLSRNLNRLVLNGATGEYCVGSPNDLRRMLAICRETAGPAGEFLAGIGSAGIHGTLALADVAQEFGAKALLLPMPHFFPYEQQDLFAYCEAVGGRVKAPVLLYNLPKFTTPLSATTVLALVEGVPNIVGIKDSSGKLNILEELTSNAAGASRIVGDDSILAEALRRNVCDGVISGVAGVLPELTLFLWNHRSSTASSGFQVAAGRLAELIAQLSALPVPWGLKWIAEARGIASASFSQPVSEQRRDQSQALVRWFQGWWPSVAEQLADSNISAAER